MHIWGLPGGGGTASTAAGRPEKEPRSCCTTTPPQPWLLARLLIRVFELLDQVTLSVPHAAASLPYLWPFLLLQSWHIMVVQHKAPGRRLCISEASFLASDAPGSISACWLGVADCSKSHVAQQLRVPTHVLCLQQ